MKKNIIKICLLVLIVSSLAIFASAILTAQADTFSTYQDFLRQAGEKGTYAVTLQSDETYFDTLLGRIITTIISFTGLIFLGLIIYSGVQWMTAGGNEERVEEAKKRTLNGVIGLAITLLAFVLTYALFNYFDERFLKDPRTGSVANPPNSTCEQIEGICFNFEGGCPDGTTEMSYLCPPGLHCCVPQE